MSVHCKIEEESSHISLNISLNAVDNSLIEQQGLENFLSVIAWWTWMKVFRIPQPGWTRGSTMRVTYVGGLGERPSLANRCVPAYQRGPSCKACLPGGDM